MTKPPKAVKKPRAVRANPNRGQANRAANTPNTSNPATTKQQGKPEKVAQQAKPEKAAQQPPAAEQEPATPDSKPVNDHAGGPKSD